MTKQERALRQECRVFTQYLLGCEPHPYAARKYEEAHILNQLSWTEDRFESFLLKIGSAHRTLATFADSYARVFAPYSLLRKKLVLLLAILETSGPSFQLIDRVPSGNRAALLLCLGSRGIFFLFSLVAGLLFFLPIQLACGWRKRQEA